MDSSNDRIPTSKSVSFSEEDTIINYKVKENSATEEILSTEKQYTNFAKKTKPTKISKEAKSVFWTDRESVSNSKRHTSTDRNYQSSQPVLWVTEETPFSQETLESLKKIGEEFAELQNRNKTSELKR